MILDDLISIFGGDIRQAADIEYLETAIDGHRAFVVCKPAANGVITFELRVVTQYRLGLGEVTVDSVGGTWWMDEESFSIPRLTDGFVFVGCRNGMLVARSTGEPTLDNIVIALRDLVQWAGRRWRPVDAFTGPEEYRRQERARIRRLRNARRDQWLIIVATVLLAALILWWRGRSGAFLPLLAGLAGASQMVRPWSSALVALRCLVG